MYDSILLTTNNFFWKYIYIVNAINSDLARLWMNAKIHYNRIFMCFWVVRSRVILSMQNLFKTAFTLSPVSPSPRRQAATMIKQERYKIYRPSTDGATTTYYKATTMFANASDKPLRKHYINKFFWVKKKHYISKYYINYLVWNLLLSGEDGDAGAVGERKYEKWGYLVGWDKRDRWGLGIRRRAQKQQWLRIPT